MGELSDLTVTMIKFGFLAVLWVFVLTAVSVMRRDLFGTRVPVQSAAGRGAAEGSRAERGHAGVDGRQARPARPQRGTPSTLVVTSGGLAGTALRLGDAPITIGRAQDATLVLSDDYASTRHARFFPSDGQWFVEDLGSTNGTYIDRSKINGPTLAPLGVPIRIGKTVVELRK